jgi:hypothetical protein
MENADHSRRNFLTTAAGIAAGGAALALAAGPALAVSLDNPQIDGELHQALVDIIEIDAALYVLREKYGDDADSRDDFLELEARRYDAIDTLSSVRASSMVGIKAKAAALQIGELFDDYERHQEIALSLAEDLTALG